MTLTVFETDREDALRDDFTLDAGYDYVDEDEWDERDVAWNDDEDPGSAGDEEQAETKDESAAYLEFLNEEVSLKRTPTNGVLSRGKPGSIFGIH